MINHTTQNDFAVIGIAAKLPEAENVEQFWLNLLEKKDSVRTLPLSRIKLHPNYDPTKEYANYGYLERIDEFDPVFFKIAPNTAWQIDPCHRLLLETVNDAIEDAGYCREQLKKSTVGVFLGNYYPEYFKYVTADGLDRLVGNLPANFAGRVAYLNGFTGPALTMDTACSSTLVALHMAIQSLKNEDCEVAVVGGANLRIDLPEKRADQIGIVSPTGKCRSFSAEADGVAGGEGVITVLIKSLEKALQDHDQIYAVIKGSAVNQDGDRSNGIAAPSPEAQREVVQAAWKKAGIDPRTISYIETHGSATKLGDPVEISGITKAFRQVTTENQFCPIGAVKTNIGHLDSVAGLAGFLKTVLALRHRKIPPTVHYSVPNPYIDFTNSPVYVTSELCEWVVSEGMPRRAGVSSFGLSGTNCHIIIEEAPEQKTPMVERCHIFSLSGPDEQVLQKRIGDLIQFLKEKASVNLINFSYTLNCGRRHYTDARLALVAHSQEELLEKLKMSASSKNCGWKESTIFILPDYTEGDERWLHDYLAVQFKNSELVDECRKHVNMEENPKAAYFAFCYAIAQLWMNLGVKPQSTIGVGVGEAVSAVLTKRLTLEEGLKKALNTGTKVELNHDKLRQFVDLQISKGRNLFLNFRSGELGEAVRQMIGVRADVHYYDCYSGQQGQGFLTTLAELYEAGLQVEWSALFDGWRISLPVHPYEKKSYWFEVDYHKLHQIVAETEMKKDQFVIPEIEVPLVPLAEIQSVEQVEEILLTIWQQRLGLAEIRKDADFIELGGDSLRGMMLMADIRKYFLVELDIAFLLEFGTISALAGLIYEKMQTNASVQDESASDVEGIDTELAGLSRAEIDRLKEVFGSLTEGIE